MVKISALFLGAVFASLFLFTSDTPRGDAPAPVLVELFTSEGCSSCPPADTLLQQLDHTQPVGGAQLIVLSEHVDYWNHIGWTDPYSSRLFSDRQSAYSDRFGLKSVYTPQMVVDGNLEFVGNDRARANQAFEKERDLPKVAVRISDVRIENGKLGAHVETDALPSKAEVFVALALEHAESQVLRGENGGHRLEHVAIVRNLVSVGRAKKGEAFSRDVTLNANTAGGPYRLVTFVQEPNQGRVLGAAMDVLAK